MSSSKTWKLILFLFGGVYAWVTVNSVASGSVNIVGLVVAVLCLVAMYGLAFEKVILGRVFWKVFFGFLAFLLVVVAVGFVLKFATGESSLSGSGFKPFVPVLFLLTINLVQIAAVYTYAFKRSWLWARKEVGA